MGFFGRSKATKNPATYDIGSHNVDGNDGGGGYSPPSTNALGEEGGDEMSFPSVEQQQQQEVEGGGHSGGGGAVGSMGSFEISMQPQLQQQYPSSSPVVYKIDYVNNDDDDDDGGGCNYVNADLVASETSRGEGVIREEGHGDEGRDESMLPSTTTIEGDVGGEVRGPQKGEFNGVRGEIQAPKYKDLKYVIFFMLHFGITIWWLVDSFIPVSIGNT